MKIHQFVTIAIVLMLASCEARGPAIFNQYFINGTMRIDYNHTGDARSETVDLDQVYKYDNWAGSLVNLIDSLNYGAYYYKVYDAASGQLIYSRGFDSYFKEYQTSSPALAGQVRKFQESALIPFPKSRIVFALEKRNARGQLMEVFKTEIDPASARQFTADPEVRIYTGQDSGDPHLKADIVIIGEGYTKEEDAKFQQDLKRFTEIFFRAEPCKSSRDKFNIRGVLKPSQDSGIDEPKAGIDKNTSVNATFSSMGSERYILTEDNKAVRDIAGHVPYDAIYIMVNHSKYGGGGIYNFYCTYTSDNINSDYLMVHEFGHSFFGLADEYYTSSTAYNNFYSPDYEPSEPNITALKDTGNIKWKKLLSEGIKIPTTWPKTLYDSIDLRWQAHRTGMNDTIALMQKNFAPKDKIQLARKKYDEESLQHDREMKKFLDTTGLGNKVGAFEGAGYVSTGLFRPSINCIMFSRVDYFCPVCSEAMMKIIDNYSR
jgi:hypothetical protein